VASFRNGFLYAFVHVPYESATIHDEFVLCLLFFLITLLNPSCIPATKGCKIRQMRRPDNCILVEILTCVDITFFTQNKPVNNHLKFIKSFLGHPMYASVNGYLECLGS
jgi:accessory gene regulator protein AgrB